LFTIVQGHQRCCRYGRRWNGTTIDVLQTAISEITALRRMVTQLQGERTTTAYSHERHNEQR
jgi:hypothetical protein